MSNTTEEVLAQIDGAIADWQVGPDAMRCNAPSGAGLASLPMRPMSDPAGAARVAVSITAAFEEFALGMAKVVVAFQKMIDENPDLRRFLGLPAYDKHHPRPLSIDGAAYARRCKARRARR